MSLLKTAKLHSDNRRPASLNSALERRLFGYAAAAAAGASMLALGQPSQAETIFTPTHKMVPLNGSLALDLNGDGITDFTFHNNRSSCGLPGTFPECSNFTLTAVTVFGNSALDEVGAVGSRGAAALPPGKKVGPGVKFANYGALAECGTGNGVSTFSYGSWRNVQNRYLALAFTIDGETHYGWARLTVSVKPGTCRPTTATLTGYAYETVAGTPIVTGKRSGPEHVSVVERPTATLGMLARGSVELDAWRRDGIESGKI